ncbi:excalibur calcium-binding domain-containing protein [Streptomyces atroolivaceus]|uniref:excalibur calcium-binding domain-containing protein n=1 Tax=Streptomyces atroolivaceus TaxID=66869 RepID=UPI003D6930D8
MPPSDLNRRCRRNERSTSRRHSSSAVASPPPGRTVPGQPVPDLRRTDRDGDGVACE